MKPYAVYGKKPRASKTSKREILSGIPVFLHCSVGATKGNIVVYHDVPPYPRIITAGGNTYWDCRTKVEEFFSKNALEILETLKTLDKNYGIPYEMMDKMGEKQVAYEIYDESPGIAGCRLICHYVDGEYIYLYADPTFAPTKTVGGKKMIDGEAVYKEYLRRKNE